MPLYRRVRWENTRSGGVAGLIVAVFMLSLVQCSAVRTAMQGPSGQIGVQGTAVPLADASGKLLFGRERAVWAMDVRTARSVQIAQPPEIGQITSARWSPDGTKIAYARYEVRDRRIPVSEIVVAAADGSEARTVLAADQAGTFFQAPVWGPTADTLYALHTGRGANEPVRAIERVDLRTGERTKVLDEAAQFDVSPDGRWLALVQTAASWPSLVVYDLQSAVSRIVVPERSFEVISSPRFDPRSQSILFGGASAGSIPVGSVGFDIGSLFLPQSVWAHGPPMDLFTVPVGGGPPNRVAALGADDPVATWSPEGDKIAVLLLESLGIVRLPAGQHQAILIPGGSGTLDWAR